MITKPYKLIALYFSIRAMFKFQLGDRVLWNGKEYILEQGTRPNSWRVQVLEDGTEIWAPTKELKKIYTVPGMRRSFFQRWNFYKGYWFDIWKYKGGIGNLAKSCSIWDGFKWKGYRV